MSKAVDFKELTDFQKKFSSIGKKSEIDAFCEDCVKELAARFLAKVIKNTPVGRAPKVMQKTVKVKGANGKSRSFLSAEAIRHKKYWEGYVGGTLRRGWTGGVDVSPDAYAAGLSIDKSGRTYEVTLANRVKYAMYVEYGHRQTPGRYVPALGVRLTVGWVEGKKMMTNAEADIQKIADSVVKRRLDEYLARKLK